LIEFLIGRDVRELRESHVKQFHQLAIENIYSCGGQYRTTTRTARLETSPSKGPHRSKSSACRGERIFEELLAIDEARWEWHYVGATMSA
jgi:hypothetical protein